MDPYLDFKLIRDNAKSLTVALHGGLVDDE